MASSTCELIWIYNLLSEFRIKVPTPIPFFCDNQSALHIATNPVFHERTKHIEIDCHIVRDKYKEGFLAAEHIGSKEQVADVFTKALLGLSFASFVSKLGLVNILISPT
ncbi:UNVERIFIED_CONTAM: hypothetical protein Sindi_1693500 [Sesamum indicum]